MREILFRGKRTDNGGWVFGNLNDFRDCKTITTVKDCSIIDSCEIIPETIGQYTGLKDKNGTRIFEGDVLSGHLDDQFPKDESRYEVVWYDYGWHIKSGNGFFDTMEQNWVNMFLEVIGNIYDNPELLKG